MLLLDMALANTLNLQAIDKPVSSTTILSSLHLTQNRKFLPSIVTTTKPSLRDSFNKLRDNRDTIKMQPTADASKQKS
jgi:hypothetical protein